MSFPADLAVAVQLRVLDEGPRLERRWRLSRSVGLDGLQLARPVPWEAGRPVEVTLTLPDDDAAVTATGVIALDRPATEADEPAPTIVRFEPLDPDARRRLLRYVEERTLFP